MGRELNDGQMLDALKRLRGSKPKQRRLDCKCQGRKVELRGGKLHCDACGAVYEKLAELAVAE